MKESKEMNENFMKDKSYVQEAKSWRVSECTCKKESRCCQHAKNNPKRKPFEPIKRGTMEIN